VSTKTDGYEALLARAAGKNPSPVDGEERSERFYAYVTGIQDRAHNIEFRKAEDSWPFLEYSYLVGGEMIHAGEFVLRFASGERVKVRGRHLRPAYDKVLRHRVTWLREAARGERAPDGELFIDEIEGPVKEEEGEGVSAS
jgi:hypothetical protein